MYIYSCANILQIYTVLQNYVHPTPKVTTQIKKYCREFLFLTLSISDEGDY